MMSNGYYLLNEATYLFKQILDECNEDNKDSVAENLAKMFVELKGNYDQLAKRITEGQYRDSSVDDSWSHEQVLDYLFYKHLN